MIEDRILTVTTVLAAGSLGGLLSRYVAPVHTQAVTIVMSRMLRMRSNDLEMRSFIFLGTWNQKETKAAT